MHARTHTHIHTHIHKYIHTKTHTHTHKHNIRTRSLDHQEGKVNIIMYKCMHKYLYTCIHIIIRDTHVHDEVKPSTFTYTHLHTLIRMRSLEHQDEVKRIAFCEDGSLLATSSADCVAVSCF
jgi:hypothetical protein